MIEFQTGRSENRLSIQNELSDVNKGIRKQDIDKWQKFGWTMSHFMNLGLSAPYPYGVVVEKHNLYGLAPPRFCLTF